MSVVANPTCDISPTRSVALLSDLNARVCAPYLDAPANGLCCAQADLDSIDASADDWQVNLHASCYSIYVRFRCAASCSRHLPQWWDATISRAHLCPDFCSDLWSYCYASGAATATLPHMQSEMAFCQFNTGTERANASACLGHLGSEPVGSPPSVGAVVDDTGLLAPAPPPRPPRPPPPPPQAAAQSPSPNNNDGGGGGPSGALVGGVVVGGCLLILGMYLYKSYQRGAMNHQSLEAKAAAQARAQANAQAQKYGRPQPAQRQLEPLPPEDEQLAPIRGRNPHTGGRAATAASQGTASERERARLHAELDAKLDEEKRQGMAADLEAAVGNPSRSRKSAASGGTVGRASDSSAAGSFARGSTGMCGEASDSERATPRDVENVRVRAKIHDPFLDLLGESTKAPTATIDAPELREAVRAARERTRTRQPRGGESGDDARAPSASSAVWAAKRRASRALSRERGRTRDSSASGASASGGDDSADGGDSMSTKAMHRKIAAEMKEKRERRTQKKKEEAASHVGGWAQAHRDIYDQLSSLPAIGPPIFPEGWSPGEVKRGDGKQLKKAYHRAAAKLHPDKVADLPIAAQALAEELFKSVGEAYQKELKRMEERQAMKEAGKTQKV